MTIKSALDQMIDVYLHMEVERPLSEQDTDILQNLIFIAECLA